MRVHNKNIQGKRYALLLGWEALEQLLLKKILESESPAYREY